MLEPREVRDREIRAIVIALQAQGIECHKTKGLHIRVNCPNGIVFGPGTPSDYRAVRNFKAQLRRAGAPL